MAAVVGEGRITYDARGLAEPNAEAPRIAEIDGGRARFDAHNLTTRQINRSCAGSSTRRASMT